MLVPFFDIHAHRGAPHSAGASVIYNVLPLHEKPTSVNTWISIGLHPWYLTEENLEPQMDVLADRISDTRVKLVGECGFDRLRGPAMPIQQAAFERQAVLAVRHNKPMIIHCVRAFDELQSYGKRYAAKVPMIVHGFNKSPALAGQLLRQGFYLSFGAAIMEETSNAAKTIRQIAPPFFLETDDSGVNIQAIYEQAAFLRKMALDDLKDIIFASWKKIQLT
ncbi:TatD DNase family protein [Parapedobacter luteus]|uniref:TatD DNase family protein n=1 Tax=Parapedobacter luteus TaxID=623280 RepID=A0A1T5CCZ8_9SPHI|nr:TatD DNase family protein [Parapedobacter luteus]